MATMMLMPPTHAATFHYPNVGSESRSGFNTTSVFRLILYRVQIRTNRYY